MSTLTRIGAAIGLGAGCGLLWVEAYNPVSHPLTPVLLGHAALGLALERALWWGRQRGAGALGAALFFGLLLAPAAMQRVFDLGLLGGATGAAALGLAVLGGGFAAGALAERLVRGGRAAGAVGLAGLLALGLAPILTGGAGSDEVVQPKAATVTEEFPKQKVAIIGIDGADWSVIDPLMADGRMPALRELIDRGQSGVLRSIVPTYSPVVWNTIFSGEPPEVHGLVDWYSSDARSRRVPMIWDIFGAHGRSSLTMNVPGTWPPSTVDRGVMLSGFPIPGLSTGDRGQMLGMVASTESESGAVPTEKVRAQGEGRFTVELPLAAYDVKPRFPRIRSALLDLATRKQVLALAGHRITLEARTLQERDGSRVRLEGPALAAPVDVQTGSWSSWIRVSEGELQAVLRVHVLEATADRLRLYVTPAYQAPWAPRFPFATGVDPEDFKYGEPYVVEALGWKAYRDPRVADLLPAALTDVEESHVSAAERLLRSEPDLFSFVITITDRVQHPFWPLYARDDYAGRLEIAPGLERDEPVQDAYQYADFELARLLRMLPPDVMVLVVSDHGFHSTDTKVEGEHRLEGIWVAAGPLIPHVEQRVELQVADVVPTVLRCVGVPLARDMAGKAYDALCPSVPEAQSVASYRQAGSTGAHAARIDDSRTAQLKAMGYIDEDGKQQGTGSEEEAPKKEEPAEKPAEEPAEKPKDQPGKAGP